MQRPACRPAAPYLHAFLLAALTAAAAAPAAFSAGFDEIMPADTVAFVVVDTLDRLGDASVPGGTFARSLVEASLSGPFDRGAIDTHRPVAIWFLASGARVAAVPLRDATNAGAPETPAARALAADGYAVAGAAELLDGPRAARVEPPKLDGTVRGFVDVPRLRAARETPEPVRPGASPQDRMLGAWKKMADEAVAAVPRVDFALSPVGDGLELRAVTAPAADGLVGALARARVPATPNRFLAAVPPDAAAVFFSRADDGLRAALDAWRMRFVDLLAPPRERVLVLRAFRQARLYASLTRGEAMCAVSQTATPGDFGFVSVTQSRGDRRLRVLVRKLAVHSRSPIRPPGVPEVKLTLARDAERIDGVPVDQVRVEVAGGAPATSAAALAAFREPVRYAYLPHALATSFGARGEERLRDLLHRLDSTAADPALARVVPPGAVFTAAWDIARFAPPAAPAGAAPAPAWGSLAVIPRGDTVEIRLLVPPSVVQRGAGVAAALAARR